MKKFRYIFQNDIFGDISIYYLTLEEIENGIVQKILNSGMEVNGYRIIARNSYTGFNDRNKKEIYSGDILKYIDPWGRKEVDHIKGVVKFGIKSINIGCEGHGEGTSSFNSSMFYIEGEWSFPLEIKKSLIIAGNIYENSKLMEKI